MLDISCLKEKVHGIKGAFLAKREKVLEVNAECDMKIDFLLGCVYYLRDVIRDKGRDVVRISITAEDQLFIFFEDSYVLGVIASSDINAPLLGLVLNKMFVRMKRPDAGVDEVEDKASQEEIPFFLRVSCSSYYKKYPGSEESDQ